MCSVSIEVLIQQNEKEKLNKLPIFKFLKAVRNITAHRFILASPVNERPFQRSVTDNVSASETSGGVLASARVHISIEQFRKIFAEVAQAHPWDKNTLDVAEDYLQDLEARGSQDIEIEEEHRKA